MHLLLTSGKHLPQFDMAKVTAELISMAIQYVNAIKVSIVKHSFFNLMPSKFTIKLEFKKPSYSLSQIILQLSHNLEFKMTACQDD